MEDGGGGMDITKHSLFIMVYVRGIVILYHGLFLASS